jgi:hypothetical protein
MDAAKRAVEAVRGSGEEDAREEPDGAARSSDGPGVAERVGERLGVLLSVPLAAVLDAVLDQLRSASHDLGASLAGRRAPAGRRAAAPGTAVVAVEGTAVPVPPEMLPSELGARAEAVEASGDAPDEPPLAPGAGNLGARWA